MSGRDRDFLDDMMDSLDEFWLYHQATKDDDDDVDLDFDAGFDIDDDINTDDETDSDDEPGEDLILTASGSARTAPYQNEDPEIYNDFFDGKNAGYEKGYELGFFAGYDTGRYDPPEKTPESPKPKDYAFSNGFKVGFDEGYYEGYEACCKRTGHASELERLKHPPYTKREPVPKQAAPVNVQNKPDTILNLNTKYPKPLTVHRKFTSFDITMKVLKFAIIVVLVFTLGTMISDIKRKDKEAKERADSIAAQRDREALYHYGQTTTAAKRTTARKTTTVRTARKKTSGKKYVYNDPDDFIDYDEAEDYYDEW